MRCDYSGGIRIDRVGKLVHGEFAPVASDQDAGGHGGGNRCLEGIPGIDVAIRLAVVGRVAADVAIASRAAHVFGGQGSRLARLGMGVPFAEDLGALRDEGRRSCGVDRARIRFGAAPSLDYGAVDGTFEGEDESKILASFRARSVERELLAHMRIHHILRAFGGGCDPVVQTFPAPQSAVTNASRTQTTPHHRRYCKHDNSALKACPTQDGLGVQSASRDLPSWCGACIVLSGDLSS